MRQSETGQQTKSLENRSLWPYIMCLLCRYLGFYFLCHSTLLIQSYHVYQKSILCCRHVVAQWARKFKNVQAKKLVKRNKSKILFSWNSIFGIFKLSPSSKIDIWPILKLQKMEFGELFFSWNWFIWHHEFFWPSLF